MFGMDTLSYNRCKCGKCGNQYATVVATDEELRNERCPNCGEKELKLDGALSAAEIKSIFFSGG